MTFTELSVSETERFESFVNVIVKYSIFVIFELAVAVIDTPVVDVLHRVKSEHMTITDSDLSCKRS